jgi:nickel-dependent lactate racemase
MEAWYGDTTARLRMPAQWTVKVRNMAGHNAAPASDQKIKAALANPIGARTIRQLAEGKKEAVIIFDDLTRPDPVSRLVPFVLDELHKGGISDDHIRFVSAPGAHKTMVREDHVKKLGEKIVEEYPVYNHNPYDFLVDLGKTSRGTPVRINREVMECDLKIGIGLIVMHAFAGFGGGAKIILPGVASMQTIEHNHLDVGGYGAGATPKPGTGPGRIKENIIRFDMEETAKMAGLDVKIDTLVNNKREVTHVFAGNVVAEHREGVKAAKKHYGTEPLTNADIVITNGYPQEDEAGKAFWAANASIKEGGTVVIVAQTPEGETHHYVYGQFGTKYGGHLWSPPKLRVPKAKRVMVFSKYKSKKDIGGFGKPEETLWLKTWREILEELKNDYPGKASVAVYPYAAIQNPPLPEDY